MRYKSLRNSVFVLLFMITGAVFSQDLGSETVVVVKPYTPSVNDAFKIKEVPVITDSLSLEKKPVQYSIFSVPVASTFSPAKGRATSVERERPPKIYKNYATLAFGSYTTAMAEFYSNMEVNRTDNFGIFLTHNSSQGGIEEVNFDDKYYDTELNLNYSSRKRNMTWNTDFGLEHRLFNWYGVPEGYLTQETASLDLSQNYFSAYLGGEMNFEDAFFDGIEAQYRYFGDAYASSEHHFNLEPVLEVPIAGELFKTRIIFDYVGGSFDRDFLSEEAVNYGFANVGLSSGLVVLRDDLTLNLGAALYYSHDTQGENSGVYLYPRIKASYRLAGEYFVAYAGLEGELKQNSYYRFSEENPFVSPTLEIQPTDQQFDLYFGGKGKLSNSLGYDIRARYKAENYKPLFRTTPLTNRQNKSEYAYGNSFEVVYDRVNTISGFGELSFDVNRNFSLRINGEYFIYDTEEEDEPWNLPNFKASLLGDYQITENWYAGMNLFIVGERKDYFSTNSPALTINSWVVSLDSYVDLNANLGYRFNEQLSAFVKGHNLLGNNYERWMDFPVLGLQVMGGVTYKFDF